MKNIPNALFLIREDSYLTTYLIKMVGILFSFGIKIYGDKNFQQYNDEFNDFVIDDPVEGQLYDIVIFNPMADSSLDMAKGDAFLLVLPGNMESGVGSSMIELLEYSIYILSRERAADYDPNEILHKNSSLPGLGDGKVASSYGIQLRYVLKKAAKFMIDMMTQSQQIDLLMKKVGGDIDFDISKTHLSKGDQYQITVPWEESEEQPKFPQLVCWNCEFHRTKQCPKKYNITSSACDTRVTDPNIEYGFAY